MKKEKIREGMYNKIKEFIAVQPNTESLNKVYLKGPYAGFSLMELQSLVKQYEQEHS